MATRATWGATLAAVVLAALLPMMLWTSPTAAVPPAVTAACLAALLVCRPPWPRPAAWLVTVPGVVSLAATGSALATGYDGSTRDGLYGALEVIGLCALLAQVVRWFDGPPLWVGAAVTVAAEVTWILRFIPDTDPASLVAGTVLWALPSAAAVVAGGYPRLAAARLRASVADARAEQRHELERDLHDYVAHDVTGMIVQAQAARFAAADDPEALREALRRIEESGRRAMSSMDRALELIREDGPEVGAAGRPGLEDLARLVADYRSTGPVALTVTGSPDRLPREVDQTLYRACLEALTNVRRHAPAATSVDVVLTVAADRAELVVTDRGDRPAGQGRPRRSGTGLRSTRARVEALGGTLVAGPTDDGWAVTVRMPLGG